jgi:two-component system, chemotaxis family, sensor kinase CheA
MDSMAAIKQTFFQECEEQLAEMETGLLALEAEEGDLETINAVFRAVHSIKGGAGAFGLDDLVRFAHTFETTLDGMRAGKIEATPALTRIMLRAADVLSDLVRVSRDGGDVDQARVDQMCEELMKAGGTAPAAPAATLEPEFGDDGTDQFGFAPLQISFDALVGETPDVEGAHQFEIAFAPKPELYAKANDALRLLREINSLGQAVTLCDHSAVPLLEDLDPEGAYLRWTVSLTTDAAKADIREIFEFVELDCDLEIIDQTTVMSDDTADAMLQSLLAEVSAEPEATPSPFPAAAALEPAVANPIIDTVAAPIAAPVEPLRDATAAPAAQAAAGAAGRSPDRSCRRTRHQSVDALSKGGRGRDRASFRRGDRAGRPRAADARDPGQRHGDPGPAGASDLPAHVTRGAGSRGHDRQVGPPRDRG